jgi:hypothetical protein
MAVVAMMAALYVRRCIRQRRRISRLTPPLAAPAARGRRPTAMSITSHSSIPSADQQGNDGQQQARQNHRAAATALNNLTTPTMFRGFTSIQ